MRLTNIAYERKTMEAIKSELISFFIITVAVLALSLLTKIIENKYKS
jgi:hypothetical protein